MRRVLLDSDIGSNIDDALALSWLLSRGDCELLGITTVTAPAVERARLAAAICQAFDRADVVVHPGAQRPLYGKARQNRAPQAGWADALAWGELAIQPPGGALEFMQSAIRSNPGRVSLLAIGPLTNVARLFDKDPGIPRLLERLVIMGGVYTEAHQAVERVEHNIREDPDAAAIVFGAPMQAGRRVAIGLDVTRQLVLQADLAGSLAGEGHLRPLRGLIDDWLSQHGRIVLNDPLAAAALFEPALCGFERGAVQVELGDGEHAGFTRFEAGGFGQDAVATSVDVERALRSFVETVGRPADATF